jgi:hypothetical protein
MEVEAVKVLSQSYSPKPLYSKLSSNSTLGSPGPNSRKTSHKLGIAPDLRPTTPIPQSPGEDRFGAFPGIAHHPPPTSLSLGYATFSPPTQAVDLSSSSFVGASVPPRFGVDVTTTTPPPRPLATLDRPLPVATLELLQDRQGKLVLASAAALGSCSFLEFCTSH